METLIPRLSQLLVVVGFIGLIIAMILKIPGVSDWLATPSGWLRFAMACGILAIAGKICWPSTGEGTAV